MTKTSTAGTILDVERAAVALHGLEPVLVHRETARRFVPRTGPIDAGDIHLDVYPARGGGDVTGTVVFVGGLSAYALVYAMFLDRLAASGHAVVALDLRGHGRSGGRRGDFTVQSALADIDAATGYARERFGGPVVAMGSSLGGFWALTASNANDAIDAAVSHFVMLPDMPVTPRDRWARPAARLLYRLAPGLRLSTRALARWDAVCDDPLLKEHLFADPLMSWRYSVRALVSGLYYQPERPLTELRVPTLVVHGELDRMTPLAYTRAVFGRLRGDKELAVIPGAGHMGGLIEHQDEVLDAVTSWIAGALRAPAAPAATPAPR